MLKIKTIVQTCGACPSSWEAILEDGTELYIRYRWGYLSVRYNPSVFDAEQREIWGSQVGDEYAGSMDLDELKELTKTLLQFPSYTVNFSSSSPEYPELEGMIGFLESLAAEKRAEGEDVAGLGSSG